MMGVLRSSFPRKTGAHRAFPAAPASGFLAEYSFASSVLSRWHEDTVRCLPPAIPGHPGRVAEAGGVRCGYPQWPAAQLWAVRSSAVPDCPICEDRNGHRAYAGSVQRGGGVIRSYVPIVRSREAGIGAGGGARAVD